MVLNILNVCNKEENSNLKANTILQKAKHQVKHINHLNLQIIQNKLE